MNATELFHAGKLQDAIAAQVAKVKAKPTDQPARFFLFELLMFTGDLDRARKQLDVLKYDDPKHSGAVELYRFALEAEAKRRRVFAGLEQPKGLTALTDHVQLRLEALPLLAKGEHAEAQKKLDEANRLQPTLKGALNGQPFEGLTDADERFGTVLELFGSGGVYSWVPLEAVESLTLNDIKAPRDVLLRPAHLVLADGLEGDVFLPGLYPSTHENADEELKLGRATDWMGDEGQVVRGLGGRLYQTGAGQTVPLLNLLQLQILRPAGEGESPPPATE